MYWIIALVLIVAVLYAFTVYLEASGRMLHKATPVTPTDITAGGEGLDAVEALIRQEFHTRPQALLKEGKTRLDLLADKRRFFDEMGTDREFGAEFRSVTITSPDPGPNHDIPGEWTLVDGFDPDRRLLYLHGGGFTVGSPTSHRPVTAALAKATGAAVFAPDYRLMPEDTRLDGIADARAAYAWLVAKGPEGAGDVRELFVSGDSAGGSLTLMVAQWARDEGQRPADALAVFSPSTDYTLSAPSIRANFANDTMLQPLFKPFMTLSRPMLTAGVWKVSGMRPSDPRNSPLFGDLSGLPPTLIQVSATEMLLDDARNYAARATEAGSIVELEVWSPPGDVPLPHVWQMFDRELPAAREAVIRAGAFLINQVQ